MQKSLDQMTVVELQSIAYQLIKEIQTRSTQLQQLEDLLRKKVQEEQNKVSEPKKVVDEEKKKK